MESAYGVQRSNDPVFIGGRSLFAAFPFARSVFDGTTLCLSQGGTVRLFVHAKLGLHPRFLVEDFPDRGRIVSAMFLIGQSLKRSIESKWKSECDSRGFLVPHAPTVSYLIRNGKEIRP